MCGSPHVDVEGLGLVDLEASRPGAVGRVHEAHAQQLVVVVARPVEDDAGAWQRGDVALWVGCALGETRLFNITRHIIFITLKRGNTNRVAKGVEILNANSSPFLLQTPSEQKPVCASSGCPAGSGGQRSRCACPCSVLSLSAR